MTVGVGFNFPVQLFISQGLEATAKLLALSSTFLSNAEPYLGAHQILDHWITDARRTLKQMRETLRGWCTLHIKREKVLWCLRRYGKYNDFFGTLPNPEKENNDFFSRHYEIALLLVIAWCGFVELPDFPWMRMGGNLSSRQTVSPTNPSFWSLGDEDVHFIIVVGNSFIIDDRVWWVRLSSFNRPLLKRSIQFLSLNARQVMIRRDG